MAWMAAIPAIIQLMQAQQPKPGPSPVNNVSLPDRSGYQAMLLNSGFNPQSDLYRIASDRAMGNINSDLANKGLGFSSAGNQAVSYGQTELANKFLENELQRRISAFNTAIGYDVNRANTQLGIGQAQNQDAYNRFTTGNLQNQQQYGNLSNIFNVGTNAYLSNQYQNSADAAAKQQQDNFTKMMMAMNGSNGNGGFTQGANGSYPPPQPTYGLGGNFNYGSPN